jgi:hypothetical protein
MSASVYPDERAVLESNGVMSRRSITSHSLSNSHLFIFSTSVPTANNALSQRAFQGRGVDPG